MQDLETTIISQYANSPSLTRLIYNLNAYIDPATDIDNFYNMVMNVDTAVGYGLDVWGRIVGVSRILQLPSGSFFGLSAPSTGGPSGLPWNQGVFYSGQALTSNYVLTDAVYRALILAKALFNISDATIPAINQILINLFGANGVLPVSGNSYCTDGLNMTMTYTFSGELDPVQTAIIYQSGVLPRPCGVGTSVVIPSFVMEDSAGNVMLDSAGNQMVSR